ncbi:retrovirus-related pol polyprotein from transposon TNT 1-94 [Tanacetum coccineum]
MEKADDQAIQTILLGLPEDIYFAVDSCETTQEIWLRVQQMMKVSNIGIQEKKAKLFNEWERFTSTDGESIKSYYHRFSKLMNDFKRNKHFPEKIASNLKFLNNLQPEWSRHVIIVHQTKDLHDVDYTQFYDFLKYNQVENPGIQNVGNQNGLIIVPRITNQNVNQNGNGNVVAAWAKGNGNGNGNNENQVTCYNCRGMGHLARNYTVRLRRRDDAYLQTQLLIAQKEEARIQLHVEEFYLMAVAGDLNEIEEVNAKCILMANLQQASTMGTQTDKALVYDSDGSVEKQLNLFETLNLLQKKPINLLLSTRHLEFDIERLLRAIVSQDIMSIVQSNSVVDTSNLQTELDRTKEKLESCIIKKEKEYVIKRLQAQLGDLKGNSKDTPCVSDTLDPLSRILEDENVIPKVGEMNALSKPVTSNSAPSTRESKSDSSNSDNACASNPQEPTIRRFPNSTSFLGRSKDEAPEVIKTFLKKIQVLLQAPVIIVRTNNGTEFKNQVLKEYFDSVGISHQSYYVRTPRKNGVVE